MHKVIEITSKNGEVSTFKLEECRNVKITDSDGWDKLFYPDNIKEIVIKEAYEPGEELYIKWKKLYDSTKSNCLEYIFLWNSLSQKEKDWWDATEALIKCREEENKREAYQINPNKQE